MPQTAVISKYLDLTMTTSLVSVRWPSQMGVLTNNAEPLFSLFFLQHLSLKPGNLVHIQIVKIINMSLKKNSMEMLH